MTTLMSTVLDRFRALENELNTEHIERREIVRGLLVALLAKVHIVLLGPPGTGKSRLARDLCSRIGGSFFEWLLTRMTTPEELFGPTSLKALEQDSYRRITTGKLPEADIAYLDETFKGSSAILNALLAVLNERIFHNDGKPTPLPLQMVVGASNELPEDREELGALWDRFLLRFVVPYIKDPNAFAGMLSMAAMPQRSISVSAADLLQAQQEAEQVDISLIVPTIVTLRSELQKQGIVASDRRWHESINVIKANAWMNGHARADEGDLEIMKHMLWNEPSQRPQVAKSLLTLVSPFDQEAQDVLDDALDAYQNAMNTPEEKQTEVGLETNKTLKAAAKKLNAIREKAEEAGKPCRRAEEGIQQVAKWGEEVFRECLKVG